MKVYTLLILLLLTSVCISQESPKTYRIKYKFKDISGLSYNVDILKLFNDGNYKLIRQSYRSKRDRRLNNSHTYTVEKGTWSIIENSYVLKNSEDGYISKFKIINNKIFYISISNVVSDYAWKKIR